jgi:nucleoside-diphosphate-sugar epimerase
MSIHTILGAGGAIADLLADELIARGIPVRLVSRHPVGRPGATVVAADITQRDQAMQAISGSAVVYNCIGLKYDYDLWRQQWPRIMDNQIEACQATGAKLLFFDNVYMYGLVDGPMTEDTPYDPSSRKGDLRARIATQLMSEVRKGNITATIARSADFYGPGTGKTSVPDLLVFQKLLKDAPAQWLVNTGVRHSFTYTPDAAKAIAMLAMDDGSWDQVWHLPTAAPALTGSDFIKRVAAELGKESRFKVLPGWMIRLGGVFDRTTKELYEMLYQYQYDYWFDSTKFEKAYHFTPTSYEDGIKATALAHLNQR